MKLPFIVLSYGDFAENKKLLSYEKDGEHLIPVFTDLNHATIFAQGMQEEMEKLGDNRDLVCQICSVKQYAIDMFTTIGLMSLTPPIVIINPPRPNLQVGAIASEAMLLIQVKRSISEILEELQSLPDDEPDEPLVDSKQE